MKEKICKNCGYVGIPTSQGLGSFFVDAMLWLIFTSFTLFSAFFPLLLLPLGWTIFHLITYKTITCPKCGNLDMVSLTSAKGKEILGHKHDHRHPEPWSDSNANQVHFAK